MLTYTLKLPVAGLHISFYSDMVLHFAGGHLVSLDISWNGIEEGAGLIATALQKGGGAPLRVLNMSGSRPSDEV